MAREINTEELEAIEAEIRSGFGKTAAERLLVLQQRKLPRELAVQFSGLCRRANIPELGLKALHPILRPGPRRVISATFAERCEYAAGLTRIGGFDEAIEILGSIPTGKHPESLLFQTFAMVAEWRYDETIPILKKFLGQVEPNSYFHMVGRVNLLSALVHEKRFEQAEGLIEPLLQAAQTGGATLLGAHCQKLAAENAINRKKFSEAEARLTLAERILERGDRLTVFLTRKWRAILRLHQEKSELGRLEIVDALHREAEGLKHYESLRECDRLRGIFCADADAGRRVYFGTPYGSYRKWIALDMPWLEAEPGPFEWIPNGRPSNRSIQFSLDTGETTPPTKRCEAKILQAIRVLSSDFYRPIPNIGLHTRLFPGEYYNPASSPHRVVNILFRVRRWLKSVKSTLESSDAGYRINSSLRILVPKSLNPDSLRQDFLAPVGRAFPNRPFSASEIEKLLGLQRRTVQRFLKRAVEESLLVRDGSGRSIRYKVTG